MYKICNTKLDTIILKLNLKILALNVNTEILK